MLGFLLKTPNGDIVLSERKIPTMPPLSYFCQLSARASSMKLKYPEFDISNFLMSSLACIIKDGGVFRSDYCYLRFIEGISRLLFGHSDQARESFLAAYDADPLNEYVISVFVDAFGNNSLKTWANSRYSEIALWRDNPDVLVVGDSHAISFHGVARCETRYVGSHTMHHIGKHGLHFPKSEERHIAHYSPSEETKHAVIAFSFGEIDARAHIIKQRERTGQDIDIIIDSVVSRYASAVASAFPPSRSQIIALLGIVPPIRSEVALPDFVYGTDQERLTIHRKMNSFLSDQCAAHGFVFIDMFTGFDDADGFISPNAWAGDHHVSARHYRELERRLLQPIDRALTPQ